MLNNLRLDETVPISTSAGSSEYHWLGSAQLFQDNTARGHYEGQFFNDPQFLLLSCKDFSLLSPFNQQQYLKEISEALHHWQDFGNSCPRIDKFILLHYDNDNPLTATEQETAALLHENLNTSRHYLIEVRIKKGQKQENKT